MKNEYKNKLIDNLDSILIRTKVISDMIEGKKAANPADAIKHCREIEEFVERVRNIVTSRNSF